MRFQINKMRKKIHLFIHPLKKLEIQKNGINDSVEKTRWNIYKINFGYSVWGEKWNFDDEIAVIKRQHAFFDLYFDPIWYYTGEFRKIRQFSTLKIFCMQNLSALWNETVFSFGKKWSWESTWTYIGSVLPVSTTATIWNIVLVLNADLQKWLHL